MWVQYHAPFSLFNSIRLTFSGVICREVPSSPLVGSLGGVLVSIAASAASLTGVVERSILEQGYRCTVGGKSVCPSKDGFGIPRMTYIMILFLRCTDQGPVQSASKFLYCGIGFGYPLFGSRNLYRRAVKRRNCRTRGPWQSTMQYDVIGSLTRALDSTADLLISSSKIFATDGVWVCGQTTSGKQSD